MTSITLSVLFVALSALSPRQQGSYPAPADLQTFYIYFLSKGPNYEAGTPEERKALLARHLAHLESLAPEGRIAGPFGTPGPMRGLVILTAHSLEAARARAQEDPAVKAGTFTVDIYTLIVPRNWFELGPVPEPYKMRSYVFFFLDSPPSRPDVPESEMAALQDRHLAYLYRLSREGKLLLAGPLTDGGVHRGIGVMATGSIEEAQQWMTEDPFVKAGHLIVVPRVWMAADGILLRK